MTNETKHTSSISNETETGGLPAAGMVIGLLLALTYHGTFSLFTSETKHTSSISNEAKPA